MSKTPLLALVLVLVAALFGATGQFIFQHAARISKGSAIFVIFNPWAIAGISCYFAVMMLFTNAFRLGGTVRVLYPLYASTFIWAAIFAAKFTNQPIRPINVLGMLLLVGGIACMVW